MFAGKNRGPRKQASCRIRISRNGKRDYLGEVDEIRKKISIAKAEVERLKNRKIIKKGRKNRVILQEECNVSIAGLVNYMEKITPQEVEERFSQEEKQHSFQNQADLLVKIRGQSRA